MLQDHAAKNQEIFNFPGFLHIITKNAERLSTLNRSALETNGVYVTKEELLSEEHLLHLLHPADSTKPLRHCISK